MKLFLALVLVCACAVRAWASDGDTHAAPASAAKDVATIALGAGKVTAPLVWTNGLLAQPDTTDLAGGGTAVYDFTVTNEGDYVLVAQVNAPGEDANSFFVNIDAKPEDPGMVWDIDVTEGVQERIVSWRGNGDADKDEIVPKKFHLAAGAHKLFLVGREPAQLRRLVLRVP